MVDGPTSSEQASLHFRARHRLAHNREFQAVLNAKVRKTRGVLMVSAFPNALTYPRLGLSVGTRVGPAVVRNRCKRLLREAFRLEQHNFPQSASGNYDLVVGVRGGKVPPALTLPTCRRSLVELARECDQVWRKRTP